MKVKNAKLEWNVFIFDFNIKKIKQYNVFGQKFIEELHKRIRKKEISNYNELKKFIKRYFMYNYWSKSEFEVAMGGCFCDFKIENFSKIDVYSQLVMNLDRITEYVNKELEINF